MPCIYACQEIRPCLSSPLNSLIIVDANLKLRYIIELALIVTIDVKLDCGNPTMMKGHSHGPVVTASCDCALLCIAIESKGKMYAQVH